MSTDSSARRVTLASIVGWFIAAIVLWWLAQVFVWTAVRAVVRAVVMPAILLALAALYVTLKRSGK